MEDAKFERKTDLPLLHVKVPFGTQTPNLPRTFVSRTSLQYVVQLLKGIVARFEGRFETIITPSDFEIEMERNDVVVLNIDATANIEEILKKLDELGGIRNDQSDDGTPMDGCKEGTGKNGDSI